MGELFQPRGLVKINGAVAPGLISFDIDANEFSSPDTFTVHLAFGAMPAARPAAWFASQTQMEVEIFAGFPTDPDQFAAEELESLFFGKVDDLDALDYDDMTITLRGRDLTAAFVDNKTSEKYVNQTASQVAEAMAAKYGLEARVTPTTTRVGVYYGAEHVDLKSDRTEWDLLTWLARQEGFRVFVKGKALYFTPPPSTSASRPFVFERTVDGNGLASWNGQSVKFRRSLTVAKDIQVTVTSWNAKQKRAFTVKATRSKKGNGAGVQKYAYRIANLTPEQAQQKANALLAEISQHEMKVAIEGPADTAMAIDSVIRVKGTGTDFDQIYFPRSIQRTLTQDGGFNWSIEAKNHSPESEPNL